MKSPFDFINSINVSYENKLNSETESQYLPFLINRAYSNFPDTVLYANEMNKAYELPIRLQYDFYRFGLSKRKRFSKWPKKAITDTTKAICAHYGYTRTKAEEIESLLSEDLKKELLQAYKYKMSQNE